MTIKFKYYDMTEDVIDTLTDVEVRDITSRFEIDHLMFGLEHKDLKLFLYEDYVYVLPVMKFILSKVNITSIEVSCDECDGDSDFDMNTGEIKCKSCGFINEHII